MWVDDAYFLPFAVAVFSLIVSGVILVECKSKRFKNFFGKRQYPPDVIAQITITEKRIKKVAYVLLFVAVIHLPLLFFSIIEGTALVFSFGWLGIDLFALGLMTYTFSYWFRSIAMAMSASNRNAKKA